MLLPKSIALISLTRKESGRIHSKSNAQKKRGEQRYAFISESYLKERKAKTEANSNAGTAAPSRMGVREGFGSQGGGGGVFVKVGLKGRQLSMGEKKGAWGKRRNTICEA